MKSLDRQSLEEQTRLVSRYVAGDLSRSERADFEAWLVASPELAAEVEMERRLRRGIASAARRGWIRRFHAHASTTPDRRWRLAIAASVVLSLVTLGVTLTMPRTTPEHIDASRLSAPKPSRLAITRTVRLGMVRGVSSAPDVSVSLADAPDTLVIEPDAVALTCEDGSMQLECPGGTAPQTPQYAEYEMDLVSRRGNTLDWRSPRQVPVERSQLSFTLRDVASLHAGDYELLVRGHSPDHAEVVARYSMRVSE